MEIDLCIVTCLRPEILEQTTVSFFKHVSFASGIHPIVNIDITPANKSSKSGYYHKLINIGFIIGSMATTYRNNAYTIVNAKPNFAQAVKTVWSNTKTDYVFHLEDDWAFLKKIDLNKCIERMEKENFDYMRFPKVDAPHLNCLHKVALQPSLWKGDVVRNLAKHMTIDKDPEKQLRTGQGNKELDKILIELQNKGLKDYSSEWCCKDIGREWREERGLIKWNKNKDNKNITWSTSE
jgi:hypothetical protein